VAKGKKKYTWKLKKKSRVGREVKVVVPNIWKRLENGRSGEKGLSEGGLIRRKTIPKNQEKTAREAAMGPERREKG